MTDLWTGRAEPIRAECLGRAAARLGCDPAAIRAVWDVEAAGRAFRPDGSVERRFEPHHLPDSPFGWRDSLSLTRVERERWFAEAFAQEPEAALRATSWGAPQIMGFNAIEAGHTSAAQMVRAMADGEEAHLQAFVALVRAWRLDSALRAHDWLAFARRWNGTGQPEVYARRMESAYRRHSDGAPSAQILRVGMRGQGVRKLQTRLGVAADGAFGPETLAAVEAFQGRARLPVDGVVGHRTWGALNAGQAADLPAQESSAEHLARTIGGWSAVLTALGGALATVQEILPEETQGWLLAAGALAALAWFAPGAARALRGRWA